MKPSYGSIDGIESRTGMTVSELLDVLLVERMKIKEAALIVWYGCEAAGEGFTSMDAVGDAVFEERLSSISLRTSLAQFLLNCTYAPEHAKKKFEEEVAPIMGIVSQAPTG